MATQYLLVLENLDTFQLENGDSLQLDLGGTINSLNTWKGAVEPAESGASGNEVQAWKGAVEPLYVASGVSFVGNICRDLVRDIVRDTVT